MRAPLLVAVFATLLAATASAQQAPYNTTVIDDDVLSAVALNAAPATRTLTKTLNRSGTQGPGAFSKARLSVFYTWSAASTVTIVFSCSADGTNYAPITGRAVSGTTAALSPLTDSYTTGGASADFMVEYDIRGCRKAKWVFSGASAGSSDLITVDATYVVGQ